MGWEAGSHSNRLVLAWSVVAVDLMAATLCALLYALNRGSTLSLLSTLAFSLLPLSGAVIIARQPRNPVGWLAAALGLTFVCGDLLAQYGTYALITRPGRLPFGEVAAWTAAWSWTIVYAMVIPFLLLIPNGRLLSSRWRVLVWAGIVTSLPVTVIIQVLTLPVDKVSLLTHQDFGPLIGPNGQPLWQAIQTWPLVQFLLVLLATFGLFVRFSRSRGVERQQLKWIFLAITVIPVAVGLGFLNGDGKNPVVNALYQGVNLLSAWAFPVGLAFAVTRYRLYDIDVLIRRTLIYSSLTAFLALVYFGLVILLQMLFTLLTGQHSSVGIVISTLVIIALFTPLRRRIQAVIDRRFFRARYNTEQLLERFASQQRESVELEQYSAQLFDIIDETLHPDNVSLYLVKTRQVPR